MWPEFDRTLFVPDLLKALDASIYNALAAGTEDETTIIMHRGTFMCLVAWLHETLAFHPNSVTVVYRGVAIFPGDSGEQAYVITRKVK